MQRIIKQVKTSLGIIINIIICILAIILDKKFLISSYMPKNDDFLSLIFPILLTMISAFTASALLAYQLIYNRYPLYPLRKKLNKAIVYVFLILITFTIFSFLLWFFDIQNNLYRFIVLLLLINSFISFLSFLLHYKAFDIHANIREIGNEIIKEFGGDDFAGVTLPPDRRKPYQQTEETLPAISV